MLNVSFSNLTGMLVYPWTWSGIPSTPISCGPLQGVKLQSEGFAASQISFLIRVTAEPVSTIKGTSKL